MLAFINLNQQSSPFCFHLTLSPLVTLQILGEDRVREAISDFVSSTLGPRFSNSPSATMADVYADMDCTTPCIFILSQGADPAGIMFRFAEEMGFRDQLFPISLGQGQAPKVHARTR